MLSGISGSKQSWMAPTTWASVTGPPRNETVVPAGAGGADGGAVASRTWGAGRAGDEHRRVGRRQLAEPVLQLVDGNEMRVRNVAVRELARRADVEHEESGRALP